MKPKTTLNLLKDFFSDIIQKTMFLPSFFEKRTWSNTLEVSHKQSWVFYTSLTFAETVFKITTAKTVIGENIKSAPPEEKYYYALQIPNF